ncbi:efflux RND transporter periplasmic adaptor subunit, partial [Candidatus Bathyarchaeota archaeon]|nr:efflux RND transporter periplasmic adaptor subunit [Candidatus Bathyarchaeota archaeon]
MRNKITGKILFIITAIAIIIIASFNLSACNVDISKIMDTFEVTKGDIIQTVTTSGYVDSSEQNDYSLSASGKVLCALSKGDTFSKGDVLIEIDGSKQELLIAQAEENLNTAKNSLALARISYQKALDANHIALQLADTNTSLSEQATQSAFIALENANELAKKSEESAYTALENTTNIASWSITSAKSAWDEAERILATDPDNKTYQYNAKAARENYEAVKAQKQASIDNAEGTVESTESQNRTSVDSVKSTYEKSLLNQSSTYWSNLSSTQSAASQIEITAKNIEQAETQLKLSEINLELAKLDMCSSIIHAPYNGIVLSSVYKEGQYASPGINAISIISSDFIIKANVNEIDVVNLQIGQDVDISLDAYYENEFSGKIIKISPISSNIGGVVSFELTVKPETGNGPELLYGLSASLDITTSGVEDVLFVPIQSVYEEDGKSYV